jgi:hypothetical protein
MKSTPLNVNPSQSSVGVAVDAIACASSKFAITRSDCTPTGASFAFPECKAIYAACSAARDLTPYEAIRGGACSIDCRWTEPRAPRYGDSIVGGPREMKFTSLWRGDTSDFSACWNPSTHASRPVFPTRRARSTRRLGPSCLRQPPSPTADRLRTIGEGQRRGLAHLFGSRQFAARDSPPAALRAATRLRQRRLLVWIWGSRERVAYRFHQ